MSEPTDPVYRVVEVIGGKLLTKITAGMPWRNNQQISWNRKTRIYPRLQEARVYKNTLVKQNRDARILKYVCEGEVE